MIPTLLHGVSDGGVTLCHVLAPSRVIQTYPSSVPAQMTSARKGEGAIA